MTKIFCETALTMDGGVFRIASESKDSKRRGEAPQIERRKDQENDYDTTSGSDDPSGTAVSLLKFL